MIKFDPKEHKYTNKKETEYTSVTTVIKRYKQPFDAVKISERYAIKHPEKTAEEWRAEWKKIGDEAGEHGTKVHAELENTVKNDPRCRTATHEDGEFIRSLDMITDLEDGLYPELLVWSDKYKIAGLVDLAEIKNGVVDLIDYKTYKKVDLKSFYNPRTKQWTCMLEPLHGLHDCNYNHAGLQMSLYALLLEELGYKIGKLSIIHIDRNGNKTPYSVPYSQFKMFVKFMVFDFMKNGRIGK